MLRLRPSWSPSVPRSSRRERIRLESQAAGSFRRFSTPSSSRGSRGGRAFWEAGVDAALLDAAAEIDALAAGALRVVAEAVAVAVARVLDAAAVVEAEEREAVVVLAFVADADVVAAGVGFAALRWSAVDKDEDEDAAVARVALVTLSLEGGTVLEERVDATVFLTAVAEVVGSAAARLATLAGMMLRPW